MHPDVQAFKDKRVQRADAKVKALNTLAVATDREDESIWAEVKALDAELESMAEAYVEAYPEQFTMVNADPDQHDELVKLTSIFSTAGMEEETLRLTMFELAKFNRQSIGTRVQPSLKAARNGS